MAIFKAPRITTTQRMGLILQSSEIVFDMDLNMFFGGNDLQPGGFPMGRGAEPTSKQVTLSATNITNKKIVLESAPINPLSVSLIPDGGIPQRNEIDFEVIGNEVSWSGMGLDGVLEDGETIFLTY